MPVLGVLIPNATRLTEPEVKLRVLVVTRRYDHAHNKKVWRIRCSHETRGGMRFPSCSKCGGSGVRNANVNIDARFDGSLIVMGTTSAGLQLLESQPVIPQALVTPDGAWHHDEKPRGKRVMVYDGLSMTRDREGWRDFVLARYAEFPDSWLAVCSFLEHEPPEVVQGQPGLENA